jgi:hypothetical protein
MHLKNIILIGIIPIFSSCSVIKPDQSSEVRNDAQTQFQSHYINTDADHIANFVSDDFVSEALNNYTVISLTKKYRFLKSYRKPVTNTYDSTVTDTIYTFSDSKNTIEIYRAKHRDFIFTFDVTSSKLGLHGNIKPQMKKSTFFQIFSITQTTANTIQIADSDGTSRFLFYFEKNKLKRITGFLYLD